MLAFSYVDSSRERDNQIREEIAAEYFNVVRVHINDQKHSMTSFECSSRHMIAKISRRTWHFYSPDDIYEEKNIIYSDLLVSCSRYFRDSFFVHPDRGNVSLVYYNIFRGSRFCMNSTQPLPLLGKDRQVYLF